MAVDDTRIGRLDILYVVCIVTSPHAMCGSCDFFVKKKTRLVKLTLCVANAVPTHVELVGAYITTRRVGAVYSPKWYDHYCVGYARI